MMKNTIFSFSFINIIKTAFVKTNVFQNLFFIKVFTILKGAVISFIDATTGKTTFTTLLVKVSN